MITSGYMFIFNTLCYKTIKYIDNLVGFIYVANRLCQVWLTFTEWLTVKRDTSVDSMEMGLHGITSKLFEGYILCILYMQFNSDI